MSWIRRLVVFSAAKIPVPMRRLVRVPLLPVLGVARFERWRSALANRGGETELRPRFRRPINRAINRADRAMWAGFGESATKALEAIKVDLMEGDGTSLEIANVALALARGYASTGEYYRALDHLWIRRLSAPSARSEPIQYVLEVEMLLRLGRGKAAKRVVQQGLRCLGEVPQLCFLAANEIGCRRDLPQSKIDNLRLEWLNKPLQSAGLAPLELKNPRLPLTLDNLAAPSACSNPATAKVSVLMPAYNAQNTITIAMASVLNQTWTDLELVVVDDGSEDDTWSAIQSFAAADLRVIALRHEDNKGAYQARNTALQAATGDFLTVHDADDWSHPQKIALQVEHLISTGSVANTTYLVRVGPDLRVAVKPRGGILLEFMASLMTRRDHVIELGGWDPVRMSGDNEFLTRLQVRHQQERVRMLPYVPLAFFSKREDLLTADVQTGISTSRYGPRREYLEAYTYWHRLSDGDPVRLKMPVYGRPFPIPNICKPGKPQIHRCDILFVSDYSLPGGTTSSNASMLQAATTLGLGSACFHWPRLEFAGTDINPKIWKILHEGGADCVVSGETVACKLVIVNHPPILNQLPDIRPEVCTEACVVIVDQLPVTPLDGQTLYNLEKILENAYLMFGVAPALAPLSPLIRRILRTETSSEKVTPLDWMPLIDPAAYPARASSWDSSRRPIVGRHARDHVDKWPSDHEMLRQAYCVDMPIDVRILGGAERAKNVLGRIPSNWTVLEFDSVDVPRFVSSLDFFVHYPHEYGVEAFARAVIEAMAARVPVILPGNLRENYGDAAVYARPADVYHTIQALWSDREAYEAQIQRGLDFIERNCSPALFRERVKPYFVDREASVELAG